MTTAKRKRIIELTVNEETYELAIECQEILLDVLRNSLGLTGMRYGRVRFLHRIAGRRTDIGLPDAGS
jgi:hypothetical protein